MVWVELDVKCQPIRIFKSKKAAWDARDRVAEMDYGEAVCRIRHRIFVRANGSCEICGAPITEKSAHMHEMKHRGQGGEISLENSVMACVACHKHQHRDRNTRWGERRKRGIIYLTTEETNYEKESNYSERA